MSLEVMGNAEVISRGHMDRAGGQIKMLGGHGMGKSDSNVL